MNTLRFAGLLIGFIAYGLQASRAQDTYTYAIGAGALPADGIGEQLTGPRQERTLVDENSLLSRRDIGGAYDAVNYMDGEQGDDGLSQRSSVVFDRSRPESEDMSGPWREKQGGESQGTQTFLGGLLRNVGQRGPEVASLLASTSARRRSDTGSGEDDYVLLSGVEPRRRESEDVPNAYLRQFLWGGSRQPVFDELSGPEVASYLASTSARRRSGTGFGEDYVLLSGVEPRRRESEDVPDAYLRQFLWGGSRQPVFDELSGPKVASYLASTSARRRSGTGFGEDYVLLSGVEPRRRESEDVPDTYLRQFLWGGSRQPAFDEFSATGAEEGKRGLARINLRPFIRNTGDTDQIEGFLQVPKLRGRQRYSTADYLGGATGRLSMGAVQDDGRIEIKSDGSRESSLLDLLEASGEPEQINRRSRNLESVRETSSDMTGSGGSIARFLSWVFRRQRRFHRPRPYRCGILYPNERFPFGFSRERGLTGGGGGIPYWKYAPQLLGVVSVPDDVGNRQEGSIGGMYDD
ncbi:uncharacterized protein LOC142576304 [Dermacentor variabilis]|uniref:uncharacterized protein LOC142576304 n=1 Tax=Dermacentor variabilis TaxID=34621 RepID=UPI003F5B1858